MGQIPNKEDNSNISKDRFIGVWYDLAGYPDTVYARSKLTITGTGALTIQHYDDADILIKEYVGTVRINKNNLSLALVTPQGGLNINYNLSYLDPRGLSILEREDDSEVRILSRDAFLTKANLLFLREKMETLGLEFDRLSLDQSVVKG